MRQMNDEGVTSAKSRERTRRRRVDVGRTSERRRRKDVNDDGRKEQEAGQERDIRTAMRDARTSKTTAAMRRQDGDACCQDVQDVDRSATSGQRRGTS